MLLYLVRKVHPSFLSASGRANELTGDSSFEKKIYNSKVSKQETLVSHGNVQNINGKDSCLVTFFRHYGWENGTCSRLSYFELYDILVLLLDV